MASIAPRGAAAQRAPSKAHPFGYGRERYFWAFVVSLVIFSLGALFALHEGIQKISDPHELSNLSWAIGVLLGVIAVVLAVEMKSLLMGEAASPEDERRILERVRAMPDVHRVIHMRTQHLGPDELMIAAKLEFDRRLSFRELADSIDVVEAAIRDALPNASIIYIEPDVYDPDEDTRPGGAPR